MTSGNARLIQAAAVAAALTATQHIILVDRADLPREARYALGVGAIIIGFATAAPGRAATLALLAAVAGGATPVVIGYELRRRRIRRGRPAWLADR